MSAALIPVVDDPYERGGSQAEFHDQQSNEALTIPAVRNSTLYEIEDTLQCLLDSADTASSEQLEELQHDICEQIQKSIEKRDRVAQFIAHCISQSEFCAKEIARLRARKERFKNAEAHVRDYVRYVIESIGADERGKFRKLDGTTATLSLRALPTSVRVDDVDKLPAEYTRVTVEMPGDVWAQIEDTPVLWSHDLKIERVADSALIKAALERNEVVEGACLQTGGHTVQVR